MFFQEPSSFSTCSQGCSSKSDGACGLWLGRYGLSSSPCGFYLPTDQGLWYPNTLAPQALSVLDLLFLMPSESTGGTLSHTSRQGGGSSQGEEWPFSSCLPEYVPGTLPFCPWAEEGLPSPGLHHAGGGGNFFLKVSTSSTRWEARSSTQSDDGQGGVRVWRMEEQVSSWEWESDWRRKSPWLAGQQLVRLNVFLRLWLTAQQQTRWRVTFNQSWGFAQCNESSGNKRDCVCQGVTMMK